MKPIVVAVSGGIDSVVLLHKLVQQSSAALIVAHFDHGIRSESDADARFTKGLAKHYGLKFEYIREELGVHASEALARDRRYAFLRSVANKHSASIATAHHQDDVIETIAINGLRGTGWRGLAVLDSDIVRPLLDLTKQDIRDYAQLHALEWVEDETNAGDAYLRNRIRTRVFAELPLETKKELILLRQKQLELKQQIHQEAAKLLADSEAYSRYFFTHIDESSAMELLREILIRHDASLTRPQRQRVIHAIKVAKPGSRIEAGEGTTIRFTSTLFIVETPLSVV